jgi:hypothetical protein
MRAQTITIALALALAGRAAAAGAIGDDLEDVRRQIDELLRRNRELAARAVATGPSRAERAFLDQLRNTGFAAVGDVQVWCDGEVDEGMVRNVRIISPRVLNGRNTPRVAYAKTLTILVNEDGKGACLVLKEFDGIIAEFWEHVNLP